MAGVLGQRPKPRVMADLTAQRTLVKSTPELWSELSEVESLAKHLGELGEIRITKVEPETTVAWEGEQISGTVQLEQSGWGTRVTFRATVPEPDPPEPEATPAPPSEPSQEVPEPTAVVESPPEPEPASQAVPDSPPPEPRRERGNFITRWLFKERRATHASAAVEPPAVEPVLVQEAPLELEPVAIGPSPLAVTEPAPVAAEPEPVAAAQESPEIERVQQVLDGTLEALGQAHHRPFSRG
jgi:hypothetical protein